MGTARQVADHDLQESLLKDKESEFLPSKGISKYQHEQYIRQERDDSLLRMERINSAPEISQVDDDIQGVQVVEISDDKNKIYSRGNSTRAGTGFKSVATHNQKQQFRSILKSSKPLTTDSLLLSPRLDASGNVIKSFAHSGERPLHKITFHENITEVNLVENWKKYNTDTSQEPSCGCSII